MKIALSTDHAGLEALRKLKNWLSEQGHECVDFGPTELNPDDDYPDFIFPAARAVASRDCDLGIIMGGSGQGEAMVANRVNGVRCALYYGPAQPSGPVDVSGQAASDEFEILRLSRRHNDANMLSLAARFLDEIAIQSAVKLWLDTAFEAELRHVRRIAKIDQPG